MTIEKIVVRAGRTFNHPYESYSNLRPEVELTATVDAGADVAKAAQQLQQMAETLVEDHKRGMLKAIDELQDLNCKQQKVRALGEGIKRAQAELDALRKEHPQLQLA
jgi:hypothetical protein